MDASANNVLNNARDTNYFRKFFTNSILVSSTRLLPTSPSHQKGDNQHNVFLSFAKQRRVKQQDISQRFVMS